MRSACTRYESTIAGASCRIGRWAAAGRRAVAVGLVAPCLSFAPTAAARTRAACVGRPMPHLYAGAPAVQAQVEGLASTAASYEQPVSVECCAAAGWVRRRLAASYRALEAS